MKTKLNLTTKYLGVSVLILGLVFTTGKNALAQAPVANFGTWDTLYCQDSLCPWLQDLSTNTPTSWFWDFGDGATSTVQSPVHCYAIKGTYTITLVVSNGFGSDTLTKPGYITFYSLIDSISKIDDCPGNCSGNATVIVSGGTPPYSYSWSNGAVTATITNLCAGTYTVFVWDITACSGQGTVFINGICGPNLIRGNVFNDLDSNCILDSLEYGISGWLVKADPGPTYGYTDNNGFYRIWVDTGTYTVTQVLNNPYYTEACPQLPYIVTFTTVGDTSFNNNFGNLPTVYCPDLSVDISTWAIRPCFSSHYSVSFCNNGTVAAANATIEVELDNNMTYTSGTGNLISQIGNLLTFGIGTANPGQCGSFYFDVDIICDMNLLGNTMCVEAHIYPDSSCFPSDSAWDHSSMAVVGSCVNDSLACFTIYNTGDPGTGDMQGTAEYRIYENNMLVSTGTFQFAGGDSLVVCWPANGNTIRLEADQRPGHPGNSHPHDNVELCGGPPFITGQITQVPEDDQDDFIEIDCREVTGSYDPNEKQVKPRGLTDISHFIDSTDMLEYVIHFQNVGNDTAFKIVIKDTLSAYLDITTIEPGASSHPYSLDIFGSDILQWTFDNIMLPDSGKDEPASNGFVKFKIQQKPGNAIGTVIENNAGIIFDFNLPVITNMVFNTVGNIDSITTAVDFQFSPAFGGIQLKVYPNPFNTTTTFEIKGMDKSKPLTFELYNIIGKQVKEISNVKGNKFVIGRKNLSKGIYIYKIHSGDGMIGAGKLVIN